MGTASPKGTLKFNVDGAAKGKPGPVGIGGILRDYMGIFGVEDSNAAELIAIREAFIIFASSRWVQNHALIIESDSLNAVKWVLNPNSTPWRLRKGCFGDVVSPCMDISGDSY
ncbi:hypothetical protein DITRI_Ditri15bG0127000 [Diplodiscus trichospermus]